MHDSPQNGARDRDNSDGSDPESDTSAEWFRGEEDSDHKAYGPGTEHSFARRPFFRPICTVWEGGYLRVHVGDILNKRYEIQIKLGWGHFSTVWLAIDRFVSLRNPFVFSIRFVVEMYAGALTRILKKSG